FPKAMGEIDGAPAQPSGGDIYLEITRLREGPRHRGIEARVVQHAAEKPIDVRISDWLRWKKALDKWNDRPAHLLELHEGNEGIFPELVDVPRHHEHDTARLPRLRYHPVPFGGFDRERELA